MSTVRPGASGRYSLRLISMTPVSPNSIAPIEFVLSVTNAAREEMVQDAARAANIEPYRILAAVVRRIEDDQYLGEALPPGHERHTGTFQVRLYRD